MRANSASTRRQQFISFHHSVKEWLLHCWRNAPACLGVRFLGQCSDELLSLSLVCVITSGSWQVLPSLRGCRVVQIACCWRTLFGRWPGTESHLALSRQAHRVVLSFDLLHLTDAAFSACACAAVLHWKSTSAQFFFLTWAHIVCLAVSYSPDTLSFMIILSLYMAISDFWC